MTREGYKKVKLWEVCKIWRWSSPRPISDQRFFTWWTIPWIKIADATKSWKYLFQTKEYVNQLWASFSRILPKWSLIMATSGTLWYVQKLGVEWCIHDWWLYFTEYDGIDDDYLYYWLMWKKETLFDQAYGAAIQNVNTDIARNLDFELPPLAEQQRIASILSAYDDLIENNTRRIALLEQMAQTLYRHWFAEYKFPWYQDVEMVESGTEFEMIPSGWEVKSVENLIEKIWTWKKYENKTVIEIWKVPVLDQGKSWIIWYHDDIPWIIASPENPIITFANHTCYQRLIMFPFSTIQNIFSYYPKQVTPSDIYRLHYATKDIIVFNDHKGHFPEYLIKKVVYPWLQLTKVFWVIAEKNEKMKFNLQKQNQSLKEQRDLLLRKLIG